MNQHCEVVPGADIAGTRKAVRKPLMEGGWLREAIKLCQGPTMDYFHLMYAVRNQEHWKRHDLAEFEEYFESTWVTHRRGWWARTRYPRTTAGTEGRWPSIHDWLGGSMKEDRLIKQVVEIV